jgi:hypothetical protein
VIVGTTKKSMATSSRACAVRKVRQVGDGRGDVRCMYLATVSGDLVAEQGQLRPKAPAAPDPWVEVVAGVRPRRAGYRKGPADVGFSRAMRRMRWRISASSRGRPGRVAVDRERQYTWKPRGISGEREERGGRGAHEQGLLRLSGRFTARRRPGDVNR